ncbi:MAG TPA: 4Fe-4S dicluster domain-containing protein [Bacillota bacterium]|nr:4Fe-4S dicluster domain-containing protein [Bacillota bacterium]
MRLVSDSSKCSGCKVCQTLCALVHFAENNPKKGALKIEGKFPVPGVYEVTVCNQCGECAAVCPVEAITLNGTTWILDRDTCIGCMACVTACPIGVMMVHPDEEAPIKCDDCGDCVRYCPREAILDADGEVKRMGR